MNIDLAWIFFEIWNVWTIKSLGMRIDQTARIIQNINLERLYLEL